MKPLARFSKINPRYKMAFAALSILIIGGLIFPPKYEARCTLELHVYRMSGEPWEQFMQEQITQESLLARLKFLAEQSGADFSIQATFIKNTPPLFPADKRKERMGPIYLRVRDADPDVACNVANKIAQELRDDSLKAHNLNIDHALVRYAADHSGYKYYAGCSWYSPIKIWERADPQAKPEPLLKIVGDKLQRWMVALQNFYK